MAVIENEIIDMFQQLDVVARKRLLERLEKLTDEQPLSAQELMQLPPEERDLRIAAAIAAASEEDFEVFEAYSEETSDA